MIEDRNKDYLIDVKNSIELINEYISGFSKEEFLNNQEKQDAVVNRLQVIGEASKNIGESLKNKWSGIPWKQMAGMRDILIHRYHGIDVELVWDTINDDLDVILQKINEILKIE